MNPQQAIAATALTKTFPGGRRNPPVTALDGLDLAIEPGTCYGLLGRNGAGKTTLLRLLLGLLHPDAGETAVFGEPFATAPPVHRARLAYVPQKQPLTPWMTLDHYCDYLRHLYPRWDQPYAQELATRFEVPRSRKLATLSGGQQRLAGLILALACRPEILVLDEPAASLDPVVRRLFLEELIEAMSRMPELTILLSTHLVGDLERLATQVGILAGGKLLVSESLDDLQARVRKVQVICADDASAEALARDLPMLDRSGRILSSVMQGPLPSRLIALHEDPAVQIQEFPLGLEDAFIALVGEARA